MKKHTRIFDSHVHFDVKDEEMTPIKEDYIKKYGAAKWAKIEAMSQPETEKWRKTWGFDDPIDIPDTLEETAQLWLNDMDHKNIEKILFITAGNYETSLKNMKTIIEIAPDRFVGYAYIDPFDKDAATNLEKAITEYGLKGVKMMGPSLRGPLSDNRLKPVWEVCEKHKCPVLIHFGIMGAAGGVADHVNISPMSIHDVAKAYPDVPFIVPHFGCGHVKDTLMLCWVCPNVYVDTSGSNQWIRWMPFPLTTKDLFKKYYETIGAKRIIFGTDGEWFPRGFVESYYYQQMKDCRELGFSDDEIDDIFYGNISRLIDTVK